MSGAYQTGFGYLKSYPGVLKILEGALHIKLIIFTLILTSSPQAQFFCGVSIYGCVSAAVLLAFHLQGVGKNSQFPWFWVECINSGFLALLLLVSASLIVAIMTKGYIVTGIIGYVTVLVYVMDAIDKYNVARTPRARYVWTTPNMPEQLPS